MRSLSGAYRELSALLARHAPSDDEFPTAVRSLYVDRKSSPTQPLYTAQWPCFALVAQGAKSITVASEVFEYGVGDFLVISVDVS